MKKTIFVLLVLIVITISGCSQPNMTTIYPDDKQMILKDRAVDLPMPFYDLSMKSQDYPRCHKKGFCSLLPKFKESDFKKMNHLWNMMTDENGYALDLGYTAHNRGIVLDYTFEFTSSTTTYTEKERALEKGDNKYLKNTRIIKSPDGEITNLNLHLEYHGKENYPCKVGESTNILRGMMDKFYVCYKFNPERTMAKTVGIRLVYTKSPNLPQEYQPLAKEYTYEDLQKRSQRVLDSLYIKDGWDK